MLRIVMDSAGDMPDGWSMDYDIQVIPINIHFGEKTYLQGIDLTNADFYRMVEETKIVPKTSQPTPQQFIHFYERIAKVKDTILSIHVTSKLSGTLESAQLAARELAGRFHIIPFDSESGSAAMGYMCKEARLLDRAGTKIETIVDRLKYIAKNVSIVLTLNTLEYARRSGRVKALQAALASLLDVKPIIVLREGALELTDRVRIRSRSLDYIIQTTLARVGQKLINAAVVHSEDPDAGRFLMGQMKKHFNCKELIMTELSTGVAANLGPGTVGIVTYPVHGGE